MPQHVRCAWRTTKIAATDQCVVFYTGNCDQRENECVICYFEFDKIFFLYYVSHVVVHGNYVLYQL